MKTSRSVQQAAAARKAEQRARARDRKRTPRMPVTGKSVFTIARVKDKPKKK